MQPNFGALTIAITLFFTLNALGNLPIFIALLNHLPIRRQLYVICREMVIAFLLILLFAYAGQFLLELLGLSQYAISIGGGVILLFIAIRLVFPHQPIVTPSKEEVTHGEPLIVPLATPIMAGGGTLATVMMYGLHTVSSLTLFIGIIGAWGASCIILLLSPFLIKIMSRELLTAVERLSGLILTLIAAQMVVGGVTSYVGSKILPYYEEARQTSSFTDTEALKNSREDLLCYICTEDTSQCVQTEA